MRGIKRSEVSLSELDNILKYYSNLILSLRVNTEKKNFSMLTKFKAPHKPLLLLAIMDLIRLKTIDSNLIVPSKSLMELYDKYCVGLLNKKSNFIYPFFHLRSTKFWELIPVMEGNNKYINSLVTITNYSLFRKLIFAAKIDQNLFTLLNNNDSSRIIRKLILTNYFAKEAHNIIEEISEENYRLNFKTESFGNQSNEIVDENFSLNLEKKQKVTEFSFLEPQKSLISKIIKKNSGKSLLLNTEFIENQIIDQYLNDTNKTRPWIIGYSGGKDSTMLLQLVWNALSKIKQVAWLRDVYIVSNNTMVENPRIVKFIDDSLKKIQKAAAEQGMPFVVKKTLPKLDDSFWVNLLGKGYPAPSNTFRWCTERLKISPTSRFILEKVSDSGEVIILLGTREAESNNRARTMKKYERNGNRLRKHQLPNAYVFAPLKDVTTNQVWQYLNQVPPPWGDNHKELITIYRNANSGDCPLVIDESSPSCGNSRFGCWVCTVVQKDKSMEALVDSGEEWMLPLLELRDFLVETRYNSELRDKLGRDGVYREGRLGPYTSDMRAELLGRLLTIQKEIREMGQDIDLITYEELVAIQLIWYRDGIFSHRVSDIYRNINNKEVDLEIKSKNQEIEDQLLNKHYNQKELKLIISLLSIIKSKSLMIRKAGLSTSIENTIENFIKKKSEE